MPTPRAQIPRPKDPNTLRLDGQPLERLLDQLDALATSAYRPESEASRRDYRRWSVRAMRDVRVDMHQPGGTVTSLRYVCRDLSGSGTGILHSSYVYPGTRCIVHVAQDGRPPSRPRPVPGVVQRCRLIGRGIHEVGIQFREPITVRDFVDIDPLQGRFSLEKIKPTDLKGGVLHIDDSTMERKLVRHMLQDTHLNVVSAETPADGRARAKENFDLIIVDAQMNGASGIDLCKALRDDGVQAPIIMVSADAGCADAARDAGACAFLRKPFTGDLLLAAVAEFLLLCPAAGNADGSGPIYSTILADNPLFKFVPEFVAELQETAKRLAAAAGKGDAEAVRTECFQVMGAAASLGLEPIGRVAAETLREVSECGTVNASTQSVKDLILACRRVREREAA